MKLTTALLVQLQFTSSTWLWLLGCLLLGLSYAFFLYGSSLKLQRNLRFLLFGLRTMTVTWIAFLLFAPMIKQVERTKEKPLVIIAQDNSASILISKSPGFDQRKYQADLDKLARDLSDEYEVRSYNFSSELSEGLKTDFKGSITDMASVFRHIESKYANRNIGALILASDGIYNRGTDPRYLSQNLKSSIYTVALGDTIPKRDLLISNVNYNHIAYLDNQFQIEVSVEAFQAAGTSSTLSVSDKTGNLFSRKISIGSGEFRTTVPVTIPAKSKGIQQYTIRISPISNELSVQNNVQTIFVEVIDGRQKVLIIADSPHPDLTAIKQSVEINKNYSVRIEMVPEVEKRDIEEAGLIILHQLPSIRNSAAELLKMTQAKPVWYILGAQSNVSVFSASQALLGITSGGNFQEVTAGLKGDFYGFTLAETSRQRIANFAPLLSPFGNYGLKGPGTVLLTQQIGKVGTDAPLLVFGEDSGQKIGVLAGEGLWRWRLEDFRENNDHLAIDELVSKTVQFLSSRDDKRKFRAYPARAAFDENENIQLNAELYNDAFELVNEPDVNVTLKNEQGKSYSYVFSRNSNAYMLDAGVLPSGNYRFSANTQLGKIKHAANGQFVITQQLAEYRQTVANHQLLYAMASQNGGKMLFHDQLSLLPELIRKNETVKTISYEDFHYDEMLNWKLIFFLILAFLSVEWFLRKRNGEV